MIKVYDSNEKLFNNNGIKILHPLQAIIYKKDNSDYYVELKDTIDNLNYYQKGMIISLNTPWGEQGFRCDNPKINNNKITCKAWHLSYDAKNYIINDAYAVNKNCNDALDHFNSNTDMTSPFTTISDITTIMSTRAVRMSLYNVYEWLVSSDKYGGHWYRDNFTLGIKENIGQDRGVVLAYNKNIDEISVDENWDDVCTKILPYTTDGETAITLDSPYVSSYTTGTPITMTKDNVTGKYYLDGVSTQETRSGKNLFNANIISTSTGIVVTNNGKTITMPIVESGNGVKSTGKTLQELCPSLNVGDIVYLNFNRNQTTYNTFVYLSTSNAIWYVNTSRTITATDLTSTFYLYANRFIDGETEQIILTDFRIIRNSDDTWEPYGAMPSPDYPSEIVNTYTSGTYQTTIDNKVYVFTLEDDLRSAGSSADRLWLDTTNNSIEVIKNVGNTTLDGSENWSIANTGTVNWMYSLLGITGSKGNSNIMSNHYVYGAVGNSNTSQGIYLTSGGNLRIRYGNEDTLANFKTWLSTHNTKVIYQLATPTTTSGVANVYSDIVLIPYTKVVKFENELSKDNYISDAEFINATKTWLLNKANIYLQEHQVPKVNYSIGASIQNISDIGDTIYVKHPKCNVNITTQVIAIEYDAIKKTYNKIEFGNFKKEIKNLTQEITAQANNYTDKVVNGNKILLQDELQQATATINNMLGNSYKVIEEDKIMFVDRLPKEEATYVLKISNGGIGFSSTGINGTFTSAWTLDGTLNMGAINVINLTASLIKGGTLKLGGVNNSSGTFELYDNTNNLIMLQDKTGITVYATNGDYVKLNAEVGFAGYDKNNVKVYWADGDTFHMKNAEVENQIKIANKIKLVPVSSAGHIGIGFVAISETAGVG